MPKFIDRMAQAQGKDPFEMTMIYADVPEATLLPPVTSLQGRLWEITAELPARVTARQLLFFVTCAEADLRGEPLTLQAAQRLPNEEGDLMFGRGLERSVLQFIEPTKAEPEALGWLTQEGDPDDRRRKLFRLTPEGRAIVRRLVEV